MKKKKRKSKNYPLEITLSTGEEIIIPRQSQFKNDWLRKHGCSLMCEYIALQWLGVKKIKVSGRKCGIYPVNLLKWHRKHTPDDIYAKVTVKGVSKGINELSKGNAEYHKKVNAEKMQEALDEGKIVIMEQKNPIHSIILLPDAEGIYEANHGNVKKVNVRRVAETATTSKRYRGMVVVSK